MYALSPQGEVIAGALRRAVDACAASAVALAVSGGRDSTVLLHLAARVFPELRAVGGLRVLHVDHGRQVERHLWWRSVEAWSEALGLPATRLTISEPVPAGESPEGWLRHERYRLLAVALKPGEALLTAHHLDDQAETFLLQGLRGCGPAGLAAMPKQTALGPGWLLRPWLDFARVQIDQLAQELQASGFDDPSNADPAFDRNFLRLAVMPALNARWPSVSRSLARSARWQAEAADALDEAAGLLLPALVVRVDEVTPGLSVRGLLQHGEPLRRVLLRSWLAACGSLPPAARHLEAIERLLESRRDGQGEVCWEGMRIRRYRDALCFMPPTGSASAVRREADCLWLPPAELELPEGRLTAHLEETGGQRLSLAQSPCVVAWRTGGERIRPAGDRYTRTLKALLQRACVPPWQRSRQPLLYRDGALVAVPGFCVAEAAAAREGEAGWRIEWHPPATVPRG